MVTGNNWQPTDPEVARLRDRMLSAYELAYARLESLEGRVTAWETQEKESRQAHKARTWQVALALLGGLVLPLAVIGIVALLHLNGPA